ncbi:MAG TPA: nuclear transport factor 2 family protein [Alphaproteobacteria bacterium]|nr:nuclear transport factor 2 family protein [Alphaproteobacteria bacterium]
MSLPTNRLLGLLTGAFAIVLLVATPPAHAASAGKLSLEQRVERLEAESIIRGKLQDYMRLLQSADWDNYIKMFAKNAKLVMAEGTRVGRASIKERMATASARMAKAREGKPVRQRADLLSSIEVHVTGPDTATARSRFTFLGENPDGSFSVTGSGLYTDKWVREDGEWRIGYRSVHWDLLHGQSAVAAAKERTAAFAVKVHN